MADPPWQFEARTAGGYEKSPQSHYRCASTADLCRLPVADIAAPSCVLWLWAISPMLDQALDLMRAWGFTFKTCGTWAKRTETGRAWAFGTGYFLRGACEPFLIGTRGSPSVLVRDVRNLIAEGEAGLSPADLVDGAALVDRKREHSRKPEAAYRAAERLFQGPHIELFSRAEREGWAVFGDEVGKFEGGAS